VRLLHSIYKEFLILIRDKAGLGVLYLMPLTLIVLMALLQDAPFRDFKNSDIPVLILDNDSGKVAELVKNSLGSAGMFKLTVRSGNISEKQVREMVTLGDYKAGIVIKPGTSKQFNKNIRFRIEKSFSKISPGPDFPDKKFPPVKGIKVYWDPVIKKSLKEGVTLALDRALTSLQAETMIGQISTRLEKLSSDNKFELETSPAIIIEKDDAAAEDTALYALNSVQHNVPAWAIFGIFFIVLPLSGNLIKEREQKTMLRLHLIPGGITVNYAAKMLAYLVVAATQFVLVVIAGKYLLPLLGLPALHTGNNIIEITLVVIALGLAASCYGILVGTAFRTHHQASTFGAVSIVILAAIGGIWIPVYVMPAALKAVSMISPLSWGMNAFNDIFLRGANLRQIAPELLSLCGFSGIMIILSLILEKNRKS
jgi:ABC-2 type transport system permease protein